MGTRLSEPWAPKVLRFFRMRLAVRSALTTALGYQGPRRPYQLAHIIGALDVVDDHIQ